MQQTLDEEARVGSRDEVDSNGERPYGQCKRHRCAGSLLRWGRGAKGEGDRKCVKEAKVDSMFDGNDRQHGGVIDQCAEIAIVGAGVAGLMKSVGDAFSK